MSSELVNKKDSSNDVELKEALVAAHSKLEENIHILKGRVIVYLDTFDNAALVTKLNSIMGILEGYSAAIIEKGLELDPVLIMHVSIGIETFGNFIDGMELMQQVLEDKQ